MNTFSKGHGHNKINFKMRVNWTGYALRKQWSLLIRKDQYGYIVIIFQITVKFNKSYLSN